jgi:hypothetical protein
MAQARLVSSRPLGRAVFPSVDAVVARVRPTDPLLCLRPAVIAAAAQRFVNCFPGDVLYAVKCNPEPRVLRALWTGGIRHFDCASLSEVGLVRKLLPAAEIHFMHPVKARPAIREAFHRYGVNDFVLDSADELAKILQETVPVGLVGDPPTLGLFVRLALPRGEAVYDLSGKLARHWKRLSTCCERHGRTPPVLASRSMSARNASSPTHTRWQSRSLARRLHALVFELTSSISVVASRSATPT